MTLKDIFENAQKESHSHSEFWEKLETFWDGQEEISPDEFIQVVLEVVIPMRQSMSDGFQAYFASYLGATFHQYNVLKTKTDFYYLLPTIYLLHHSIELFLKMVKIDVYNMAYLGGKKVDVTSLLLPANIKDLKLECHKIDKLLVDKDVSLWFSVIRNGKRQLSLLAKLYKQLCKLTVMSNPAEEARYPFRKDSYLSVDRSYMSEEIISKSVEIIGEILSILSKSYISWHTQDASKLLEKSIKNSKPEDQTNAQT